MRALLATVKIRKKCAFRFFFITWRKIGHHIFFFFLVTQRTHEQADIRSKRSRKNIHRVVFIRKSKRDLVK